MIGIIFLLYVGLGALFAAWFFVLGHRRVDPSSTDAAWYTRLLWVPGAVLLWPVLVRKAVQNPNDTETGVKP